MENKYAIIIGARPNYMKAAPLAKTGLFTVIHTGQHYSDELSANLLRQLGITVDYQLEFSSIGKSIRDIRTILQKENCTGVIVFGDVNSTLAGTLAGRGLKTVHIEAGLRSNDLRMPEEVNRIVVDHLSDILFVSEPAGAMNLINEGVKDGVHIVGNLMVETLETHLEKIVSQESDFKFPYYVATIHRRENKHKLDEIMNMLGSLPLPIIIPLHPGTQIEHIPNNVQIVPPMNYFDFINLMMNSRGVITDSGGIQEETTHLGIPCATIRDNTERPITVSHGSNKLFSNTDGMVEHLSATFPKHPIPLWDTMVSQRILSHL